MRIISRKALRVFWEEHPDARQALQTWYADVKHALWKSPADIKKTYRNASFVANNRVVFDINQGQQVSRYRRGAIQVPNSVHSICGYTSRIRSG